MRNSLLFVHFVNYADLIEIQKFVFILSRTNFCAVSEWKSKNKTVTRSTLSLSICSVLPSVQSCKKLELNKGRHFPISVLNEDQHLQFFFTCSRNIAASVGIHRNKGKGMFLCWQIRGDNDFVSIIFFCLFLLICSLPYHKNQPLPYLPFPLSER